MRGKEKTTAARFMVAAVVVSVLAFYFIFDPLTSRLMPQCLFHRLTGLQCVGCGSQRMLHALLHGHLTEAFRANALAFLSLPSVAFLLWLETRRRRYPGLYRRVYSPAFIIGVTVVFIVWFVVRNALGI